MSQNDASPPAARGFAPGELLGSKYRVERVLGEGGLGIVVLARHEQLDRLVAVKYLQPRALEMPDVVERFVREGRLVAMLRSEHVVKVHDVATLESGEPYLVMEYLEGRDLGEMLTGPLPIQDCVDYVTQACDALAEAHGKGIIHRDIKPGNLFVCRAAGGGSVLKVLDFGISKLSDRSPSTPTLKRLTTANQTFGTPAYMPPEQLDGSANVDERSDIWALGVVLYETLTGTLPFDAPSIAELCIAVLARAPVSPRTLRPDLPASLERTILRCLSKMPDDRFQNVAELVQELTPFASARMQLLADQVVRVVKEGGVPVAPSSSSLPVATRSVLATSTNTWAQTDGPAAPAGPGEARSRGWLVAGVGVSVLLAATSIGLVAMSRAPRPSQPTEVGLIMTQTASNAAAGSSQKVAEPVLSPLLDAAQPPAPLASSPPATSSRPRLPSAALTPSAPAKSAASAVPSVAPSAAATVDREKLLLTR